MHGNDLNAFKQSLFAVSGGWEDLPLRSREVLRLQLVSQKTSMRMLVEVFIVPDDELDEGEKPEQGAIVLYNRDGEFMLDSGFFLAYHPLVTEFVVDVIEEREVVVVYEKGGDWAGSKMIRPTLLQKDRSVTVDEVLLAAKDVDEFGTGGSIRYIRSWNGTYDWR